MIKLLRKIVEVMNGNYQRSMADACAQHDDFFDALEELSSESHSSSDDYEGCTPEYEQVGYDNDEIFHSSHYDFWCVNPKSIDERRDDFTRKTGFVLDRCQTAREGPDDTSGCVMSNGSTVGANEHEKGKNVASHSHESVSEKDEDLYWRIHCLDDEQEFDADETDNIGMMPRKLHESRSNCCNTIDKFQETFGSSDLIRHIRNKRKQQYKEDGWLKRFSSKAASMLHKDKENNHNRKSFGSRSQRVRVHTHKKWSKQLSSLYNKQEFSAHKGSILAMKFSSDGQYLATGGEDGILNVWKVVEEERINDFEFLSFSVVSAGLNFFVNGIPNLACFLRLKDEGKVSNKAKKSSDSAGNGILVPRKVFQILEKPWHEFHGHEGGIPDISWSKNGHLLSSSVDKTVRLWKVGCSQCLRVFPHNDFVTCAQFNPMDDNYFISGSIDGKVRVWDVRRCQVVDWIDIKEIVTAICYRPDGKGGIVGSMVGNCSFFDIADDFLHQVSVIYLQGKKSLTCKRITGFQFSPSNPSEVAVSSADSLVRILKGVNLACKLRVSIPLIDRGCQAFASFTVNGKHIVSATKDSNVYVWNHLNNGRSRHDKPKNIWSCERFLSPNALVAVPWHGITSNSKLPPSSVQRPNVPKHTQKSFASTDDYHNVNPADMSSTIDPPAIGDIDYKFLRNVCESILSGSHMWGLVIVTGGKDGRIRTYHNYGLPVRYPTGKSIIRSSFSLSSIKNRCRDNCGNLGRSASFSR